jgi:hypothetical protein
VTKFVNFCQLTHYFLISLCSLIEKGFGDNTGGSVSAHVGGSVAAV